MEIAFLSRWLWGWNIQDVWHQDKRFSFFLVVVVFLLSENICFVEREVKTCSNGKHFIVLSLEWVSEREKEFNCHPNDWKLWTQFTESFHVTSLHSTTVLHLNLIWWLFFYVYFQCKTKNFSCGAEIQNPQNRECFFLLDYNCYVLHMSTCYKQTNKKIVQICMAWH